MATTSTNEPPESSINASKPTAATTRAHGAVGTRHPFAGSTAKLELLPPDTLTVSGIDIEEEARLYDELCEAYESEARTFDTESRTSYARRPNVPESTFSADIFLADNTGLGCFAKDATISGWTTVAGDKVPQASLEKGNSMKNIGAGAYVVYDCVITTKEGTTFHTLKRYTAFEELDHALRLTVPRTLRPAIPKLPPKAPFAKFRPAFLDRRRQHLQFWLARVLLHPEIGKTEVVKRWVVS
ncbi:hypothetical protein FA13DRAFT_1737757 [Coprinellus micaceus]|uniref:Endosomal/vacuolar adapter protein YPT35 n=1 Tax=Coprinellus micaceus TaxID=71717 RepID=A0A4Y7SW92_COPMI|nr:hypothetical protein FA13DRAFT_1737757 [Coprinellus micaceus]